MHGTASKESASPCSDAKLRAAKSSIRSLFLLLAVTDWIGYNRGFHTLSNMSDRGIGAFQYCIKKGTAALASVLDYDVCSDLEDPHCNLKTSV